MNACSLASVVPAMVRTTLEEALLGTRMLKLVWKGTSTRTRLVSRKWVLVHRGSKDKLAEAKLNSCSKKNLAAEEALDILYHHSSAGKNTGQHGNAAAHRHSDELWWELRANLPSGPFQRGHHCIPSCCFLSELNRSYGQETNLASGKQAAQRDAWTMPGLWAGCYSQAMLLDMYHWVKHRVPCLLPLPPVWLCKLPGCHVPRPWRRDSRVTVSRRSMQYTKSEKPILLAASPYRKVIRRRSCSLAARPAEGRGTSLRTPYGMMDWLRWPCAPCKEAGALPQPPHLVMPAACLSPGLCIRVGVEWWKIKVVLVTYSNCGLGQQAGNTELTNLALSCFPFLAFIFYKKGWFSLAHNC